MSGTNIQINLPQPNAPVLNAAGTGMAREWWYALLSLVGRTGGAQGISSTVIVEQITISSDLATLSIMEDGDASASLAPNIQALIGRVDDLSAEVALSDEPEPSAASPALMALAFQDEPERIDLQGAILTALALQDEP